MMIWDKIRISENGTSSQVQSRRTTSGGGPLFLESFHPDGCFLIEAPMVFKSCPTFSKTQMREFYAGSTCVI